MVPVFCQLVSSELPPTGLFTQREILSWRCLSSDTDLCQQQQGDVMTLHCVRAWWITACLWTRNVSLIWKESDCSGLWTNVTKSFQFVVWEQKYFTIISKKKKMQRVINETTRLKRLHYIKQLLNKKQITRVIGGENQKTSTVFTSFAHHQLLTFFLVVQIDTDNVLWLHYSANKHWIWF